MAANGTTLQVKGLGRQTMTQLASKAKRLGITPERYVKELVQDDLEQDQSIKTTTLAEIMGPGEETIDDAELDKLVEAARKHHHQGKRRKR